MTTKLEEQFFKAFGVEPEKLCFYDDCAAKDEIGYNEKICDDRCVYIEREYPEITDRKLLEMICIIVQSKALLPIIISENIKNLKDEIIQMTIDIETKFKHNNKIDFKHQIQQLFKEEE